MTAPKEVRKFFVPEQMLFNNIDDAFSVDKGAVAFVVDKYDHDTEVQALKADLERLVKKNVELAKPNHSVFELNNSMIELDELAREIGQKWGIKYE